MQNKVLLAVDGSERCKSVILEMGQVLKSQPDSNLLLYHCVQRLGAPYTAGLYEVANVYHLTVEQQKKIGESVLEESRRVLLESGFPENRVQVKLKLDSDDPAQDILDEAKKGGVNTIAVGRRGLTQLEGLLIGSTSCRVAQYSGPITVWIVDTPLHQTKKALVSIQGIPGGKMLTRYVTDSINLLPYSHFTLLHLLPPMPPTFWDDGHILNTEEQKARQGQVEKWRSDYMQQFEKLMAEGRDFLIYKGASPGNIEMRVEKTRVGIARDLLDEIAREKYQMVIMGKKSLQKKTPFLMGSIANKLLYNARGVILCLVGSE